MMKRKLALIVSVMTFTAFAYVNRNPADVHVKIKDKEQNHTEVNPPADMPDVYYDSELGVITIVDYANVTYNPISLIRVYGRTAFVLNRLPQWGRSHSNYGKPSVAARCQKKGCYAMKRLEKNIYLSA